MDKKKDFLRTLAEQEFLNTDSIKWGEKCFVFPSHRASVFFSYYLQNLAKNNPVFSPKLLTIENFILSLSGFTKAERPYLLALLLKETCKDDSEIPSIDFLERILNDFNDIDNFLVDPLEIFQNHTHLQELENWDYLSEEQKKTILAYWGKNALPIKSKKGSSILEQTLENIKSLYHIYLNFNKTLEENFTGYTGSISRRVAEKIDDTKLLAIIEKLFFKQNITEIIFVGLHQITKAEEIILQRIKKLLNGKVAIRFIWEKIDFDFSNLSLDELDKNKIIGPAYSVNKKKLGGEFLELDKVSVSPSIEIIQTSSDTQRSKCIPTIINEILTKDPNAIEALNCAIIVPKEDSLPPLLETLRNNTFNKNLDINLTMGYPLSISSISIWVNRFLEYQMAIKSRGNEFLFSLQAFKFLFLHPLSSRLFSDEIQRDINRLIQNSYYYLSFSELKELPSFDTIVKEVFSPINSTKSNKPDGIALLERLLFLLELIEQDINKNLSTASQETEEKELYFLKTEYEFTTRYTSIIKQLFEVLTGLINKDGKSFPLDLALVIKFLQQLINSENFPFEGEPIKGLQVMGLLESRLMYFDHIIITDANNDIFPKSSNNNVAGYLPRSLRIGYGLPTNRDNNFTESYNFYRLIQRAKKIYFITGSSQDYEPSHFIAQLRYLFGLKHQTRLVSTDLISQKNTTIEIPKKDFSKTLDLFKTNFKDKKNLSATSLSDYIQCPLKFFYKHIQDIKDLDDDESILSPAKFGTILHNTMEEIYEKISSSSSLINEKNLLYFQDFHILDSIVSKNYAKVAFNQKRKKSINGVDEIFKNLIIKYTKKILEHDATETPFEYLASEEKIDFQFNEINITGSIDRVDKKNGIIRIIDYKTGSDKKTCDSIEDIFNPDKNGTKAFLQLLLYSYYYQEYKNKEQLLQPLIYSTKEISVNPPSQAITPLYFSQEKKELFENLEEQKKDLEIYKKHLGNLITQIFDLEQNFTQTKNKDNCTYCPFNPICGIN